MNDYDYLVKLLLIGDSGVGKSCIMMRFADDSFSNSFITTIGIDFKIKTITLNNKKIKLQIWDTAGQERFRTITTAYYRGAMGIIMVYDITDELSFSNIRNWMLNIETHASINVKKIMVGNKIDMESYRVVTREKGENLANEYDMNFFETSARENINITEMFTTMVRDIIKDMVELKTDKTVDLKKKIPTIKKCCK